MSHPNDDLLRAGENLLRKLEPHFNDPERLEEELWTMVHAGDSGALAAALYAALLDEEVPARTARKPRERPGVVNGLAALSALTGQRGTLYAAARKAGDVNAVVRSIETGSPRPLVKRGFNKLWGRLSAKGYAR